MAEMVAVPSATTSEASTTSFVFEAAWKADTISGFMGVWAGLSA